MIPVTGAGSMVISGSGCGRKAAEVVPEQFPAGLRVLVVDDDSTCLVILERMLKKCSYEVTKCQRAEVALSILRENKNGYDLVLSDVHMPDMDGFKLLEHIGLEMDLPVIMMSADEKKSVVLKGVTHGACDYLIKPVRMEALMNIWQHVVRKKRNEWRELENSGSVEDGEQNPKPGDDGDYSSAANEGNWQGSKRKKDDDDDVDERDDSSTLKKPRVVWSVELHQQFVAAVNQLSIEKAVPKKILELMNVPGLTRENVASHLQKYRLYLKRVSGVTPHQMGTNGSFMGGQEMTFGHIPPLEALDLHSLGVPFAAPGLAAFQVPGMGRPGPKSMLPAPLMEPNNNIFSFEGPPKMQFGEVRAPHPPCLSAKSGLLHGVPAVKAAAALKRLPDMQQQFGGLAVQGGALMLPAPLPQPAACETSRTHLSRLSSPLNQPVNGMPGFSSRNGTLYNPQASPPLLDFPTTVFPGGTGISKSVTGVGGSGIPAFETQHQHQHQQNVDVLLGGEMVFDPSRHPGTLIQNHPGCRGAGLFRPGFRPGQTSGMVVGKPDTPLMNKDISLDPAAVRNPPQQQQQQQQQQHQQNVVNPVTGVVSTSFPFETASELTFDMPPSDSDNFGEDDLLNSLLLKQEFMVPFEGEFDMEGFVMDDILV